MRIRLLSAVTVSQVGWSIFDNLVVKVNGIFAERSVSWAHCLRHHVRSAILFLV
jgi:hypothetical protein